jgi:DNA-binding HxlR family transcriptional regulator
MFRIVELLRSGPMRYREIVSELGVKSSTLGNDMKDLRSQGLIRREGHTRNAVWHLV